MTAFERAAVIGLGLVGGSVARDLAADGVEVFAYDSDPSTLEAAVREGVVRQALTADLSGVRWVEMIVVAVPVDAAVDVLQLVAPYAGAARLITDVGSTKARIVDEAIAAALGDRFVGSHPMAGDHRSGWAASRAGLFRGACVYLCPAVPSSTSLTSLASGFWQDLGALPVVLSAARHDQTLAWTSHLPHMLSTALALALARTGLTRDDLGPGGRDVTRLAGSSPDVWTPIARDNATAIETALAAAEEEIAHIRGALLRRDEADLRRRLVAARAWFLGSGRNS
jgi:prephenate dehydrogenase